MHPGAQVHRVVVLPRPREKRRDTGVVSRLMAILLYLLYLLFSFFLLGGFGLEVEDAGILAGLVKHLLGGAEILPVPAAVPVLEAVP